MTTLTKDAILRPTNKGHVREEEFGYLLLGAAPFAISADGKKVLDLVDGKRSIEEIVNRIENATALNNTSLKAQYTDSIINFLESCLGFGVLTLVRGECDA